MRRILAMMMAGAWVAAAADPAPPELTELSLRHAVELALTPAGNTRLQLAAQFVAQSESRVVASRAALLPNLDGSYSMRNQTQNLASFGFSFPSTILGLPLSIPSFVGPFTVFDARLSASTSVFDYANIKRFQAAKESAGAAQAERDSTRDQVTEQVAQAYLVAVRADDNVATAQANLELSKALVKLAKNQKDAGTGTGIDIVRAQVQEANDRQRLVVSGNEREKAYLQLSRVIGLPLVTSLKLTDRMAYLPVDETTIDAAIFTAKGSRVDLKAQERRVQAAQASYSAAKMANLPTVSAIADVGPVGTTLDNARTTREYGFSVKIPVWDSGRRAAQRADAMAQWKQEQIKLHDLREQVDLDVRLAANALRSAEEQIKVAKEGLSLADQELAQARRRFENGVTNSIEVTDAQTRLQRARDNHVAALFAHNLARIEWFAALGKIDLTLDRK